MQQKISLKLLPHEAADESAIKKLISRTTSKKISSISGFQVHKKSIDARSKTVWINLTVNAFIDEPFYRSSHRHDSDRDGKAGACPRLHRAPAKRRC